MAHQGVLVGVVVVGVPPAWKTALGSACNLSQTASRKTTAGELLTARPCEEQDATGTHAGSLVGRECLLPAMCNQSQWSANGVSDLGGVENAAPGAHGTFTPSKMLPLSSSSGPMSV